MGRVAPHRKFRRYVVVHQENLIVSDFNPSIVPRNKLSWVKGGATFGFVSIFKTRERLIEYVVQLPFVALEG